MRSHAAGNGPEVEREVVRAMMLLRLSTLATGHTGIRPETAQTIAAMLTHGITPIVHEHGSLGCSGDLAPLAHCALAVMGEGTVRDATGKLCPAAEALADVGLRPVELAAKEGLALINGTDGMLGMLILAQADLAELLKVADIAAAMSVEALLGTDRVFAEDLQALRPHPGQVASAANLRRILAGSAIVASHRGPDCTVVQDAYSLRCSPQVTGAARDTLDHTRLIASRELASAVDNPVVLDDGRVESNGNFHGAPVGYALDFLAIPVADVASMSERRTDRFLDASRSNGLPAFLAHDPGVDSGHMIAQYTQASIVSELKRLRCTGQCRFDPFERHARRPRRDGLVSCSKAPPCHLRTDPGAGHRNSHRRTGFGAAAATDPGPGNRRRGRRRFVSRASRARDLTASSPRRSRSP